jgi:hypothetical protein
MVGFYKDGNGPSGSVISEEYHVQLNNYKQLSGSLRHGYGEEWDF